MKRLLSRLSPATRCCLAFIVLIILGGALAPHLSPYSPAGLNEDHILEAPSREHWMGTDGLGRDVFTRVLYGSRVSLAVGIGTAFLALLIGATYGLISGYWGGHPDHLLMRFADVF